MNSSQRELLHCQAALPLLSLRQNQPQLALLNTSILTMDPARPRPQVVAIDGQFLAAGSNEEGNALAGDPGRCLGTYLLFASSG